MSRKKEPACVTEGYTFPVRLREVMKAHKTTQKELAEAIGVRPQTVSLYVQGQSFPDVNGLAKIARYFQVSADYLIGLAAPENATADEKLRLASEYTGLSNEAVETLRKFYEARNHFAGSNVLSLMISDSKFDSLLSMLEGYFSFNNPTDNYYMFVATSTLADIAMRVGEKFKQMGYKTSYDLQGIDTKAFDATNAPPYPKGIREHADDDEHGNGGETNG